MSTGIKSIRIGVHVLSLEYETRVINSDSVIKVQNWLVATTPDNALRWSGEPSKVAENLSEHYNVPLCEMLQIVYKTRKK
jgi:hypothetical protein